MRHYMREFCLRRLLCGAYTAWATSAAEAKLKRSNAARAVVFLNSRGLVLPWNSWKQGIRDAATCRHLLSKARLAPRSTSASTLLLLVVFEQIE